MCRRFEDRVVVVTGGAQGIGRATCERFAAEGASVVVADVQADTARQVASQLSSRGSQALAMAVDVADEASVAALIAEAAEQFGRIDVLVNNAAIFVLKGLDAPLEEWRRSLEVNVIGTVLASRHVVPVMRRGGGGAIVNLGSISSFIAQPQVVAYSATKAAIANMTRCMALDLAADRIRVNAVCPGTVWTPIVERLAADEGLDRAAADAAPAWGGAHLLNRLADPHEIAAAIAFLASDDASFITGENLMVDGGYTAR